MVVHLAVAFRSLHREVYKEVKHYDEGDDDYDEAIWQTVDQTLLKWDEHIRNMARMLIESLDRAWMLFKAEERLRSRVDPR